MLLDNVESLESNYTYSLK